MIIRHCEKRLWWTSKGFGPLEEAQKFESLSALPLFLYDEHGKCFAIDFRNSVWQYLDDLGNCLAVVQP